MFIVSTVLAWCSFYRVKSHHRAPRAALDEFFERNTPSLTALVPSYQEDARVIRNTLLSVALQEYPDMRVVLLIDDPVLPRDPRAHELLEAARALPGEIQELLAWPASRSRDALATGQDLVDHTDAFFANHVLRRLARDLGTVGGALRQAAAEGASLPGGPRAPVLPAAGVDLPR